MIEHEPEPISAANHRARVRRIEGIARSLGFVGEIEYRHVYSRSGGAQYCIGPSIDRDLLVIYAEAFERDAKLDDFPLESMIAHECGHQALVREERFRDILRRFPGERFEEILASLLGSVLLGESRASMLLFWKATSELAEMRVGATSAVRLMERLQDIMRRLL
jgi:hypothetical protein